MNSRLRLLPLSLAAAALLIAGAAILAFRDNTQPPLPSTPTAALPVIGPSPAWQLTTLDGKPIGRDTLKGKIVVLDFWATWCPPCVREIPGYVKLQKKYADKGLVIVGLSVDRKGAAVVKPFAKKNAINFPLALATFEIAETFGGIEVLPTTFLIDREGNVRHRKVGAMETEDYEKLILSLL